MSEDQVTPDALFAAAEEARGKPTPLTLTWTGEDGQERSLTVTLQRPTAEKSIAFAERVGEKVSDGEAMGKGDRLAVMAATLETVVVEPEMKWRQWMAWLEKAPAGLAIPLFNAANALLETESEKVDAGKGDSAEETGTPPP